MSKRTTKRKPSLSPTSLFLSSYDQAFCPSSLSCFYLWLRLHLLLFYFPFPCSFSAGFSLILAYYLFTVSVICSQGDKKKHFFSLPSEGSHKTK
ncbi:unnamed protein product, partial [Musa hybrid cultivar]